MQWIFLQELKQLDIPFHLLIGESKDVLPSFVQNNKIGGVVTDFSPLRVPLMWVRGVTECLPDVPMCQVISCGNMVLIFLKHSITAKRKVLQVPLAMLYSLCNTG